MKKIFFILFSLAVILVQNSCKKKPETPPITNLSAGTVYPIDYLKIIATCTNACERRFTDDSYLIGVVIADEVSGNFYKELYVRDRKGKGAIRLDFLFSNSGLFIGDSVRMNMKGYDIGLNSSTGMLEIDSVDHEKAVTKFGSGPKPAPIQLDLSQIGGNTPYSDYLCDLVTINNVGFIPADTNQIWADAVNQMSINRTISDCSGNTILVRTSNYAGFASQKTPKGMGSITGIATAYISGGSSTNQLAIRHPNEANMNGAPCIIYHKKDFNNNSLTSGGWTNRNVTGSINWITSTLGSWVNKPYASISNYVSPNNINCETWLVSPSLDLSAANNPVFSFQNAYNYSGPALTAWVSTNYVTGLPATGTWTQLTYNASLGGFAFLHSGNISLNAYKTSNVHVAFKYTGTSSSGSTWEVDDIVIREN